MTESKTSLDDDKLGEVVGKLIAGERTEAVSLLAGLIVTALTVGALGPAAPLAGRATTGSMKLIAKKVADSATKRFLAAGVQVDVERQSAQVLRTTMRDALEELATVDRADIEELGAQSREEFLQLLVFLMRNVVDPQQEVLALTRELHGELLGKASKPSELGQLIALGPKVVATGERIGVQGASWALLMREFVIGGMDALSQFIEDFVGMPALYRFVLVEDGLDAREVTAPPTWTKSADGIVVSIEVGSAVEPRDVSDSFDLDVEDLRSDGNFGHIQGGALFEQLVERHFTTPQGEFIDGLLGTWLRDWLNQCSTLERELVEHLFRLELLRLSRVPVTQVFRVRDPLLWGVERLQNVSVTRFAADAQHYTVGVSVSVALRGVGSHKFEAEYQLSRQPAERPRLPLLDEFRSRDEVLNQVKGYWRKPDVELESKPAHPPDGSIVPEREHREAPLGLVLRRIGTRWEPIAHRSASSLPATAAVSRGESWTFTVYDFRDELERAWRVEAIESIPADDVERLFGSEAKWRAPRDRAALAVRLRPLPVDKRRHRR